MNLSELSTSGRRELIDLLTAWDKHGLPKDFLDAEVHPVQLSGQIGLENEDYQLACLDESDHKLKFWHTLPSSNYEGFLGDLMFENAPVELDIHDERYIREAYGFKDLVEKYPAWAEED